MELITPQVRFAPESLHRSKKGSITGFIWFDFDQLQFPEPRWSDFVVVVGGWWICALRSNARSQKLLFMDGPLFLRIDRQDSGHARVDCVRTGVNEEELVKGSFLVDFVEFRRRVIQTGQSVLKAVQALKWNSRDVRALAQALEGA